MNPTIKADTKHDISVIKSISYVIHQEDVGEEHGGEHDYVRR